MGGGGLESFSCHVMWDWVELWLSGGCNNFLAIQRPRNQSSFYSSDDPSDINLQVDNDLYILLRKIVSTMKIETSLSEWVEISILVDIIIVATLGSILDSQLIWESGKSQLARWSHKVELFPERNHPSTRPYGFSSLNILPELCAVSPPLFEHLTI